AIVASQPFGGEGLSGTGPKAGGPHYLPRFAAVTAEPRPAAQGPEADPAAVQAALDAARPDRLRVLETLDMPGPTGESNRLRLFPRGVLLCLGPDAAALEEQRAMARQAGCVPVAVAPGASGSLSVDGRLAPERLTTLAGFDVVALWGDEAAQRAARRALAARDGPILPLVTAPGMKGLCVLERHLCIDTTASGGNAALLAEHA
ncbi:MAG: bifunctional proline dehydrogenase/L-glutamate gamma-semialdehyde dehydrogenase, partial [Alphaproteobacteria bacterium]